MNIDFDKWFAGQGATPDELTLDQIALLREYPECKEANDLPFDVQQKIIDMYEFESLQGVCDAFLAYQYSLVTNNLIH
jgi:hypothetical protein